MTKNKFFILNIAFIVIVFLSGCSNVAQHSESNYLSFNTTKEIQEFFRYKKENKTVIVSGHRGGREKYFPENSIEGFQNVLDQMPAFFEIDPRLTKDSVIVLMHDVTLDRTTDTTGRLADYTWEDLKNVQLKDNEGNLTPFHIPTLEEVIKWSRGKTVLNLDKKDVPSNMIVDIIKRNKAENHVMVTVHTGAQARYYTDRIPGLMLSVFVRNNKEYEDISISGITWKNMIAYVGRTINNDNKDIVHNLRVNGVRCMVSYAPTIDKLKSYKERELAYREEIRKCPDIIESDMPTEIWRILQNE